MFDRLRLDIGRTANLDPAWLQRLGRLAHQIDVQHAVSMACACHADMVSQRKPALEGTGGYAAMQKGLGLILGRLAGRNVQRTVLDLDRQLVRREPGHGD